VPHASSRCPRNESPAGELRPLIGADGQWIASELRGLVQQAHDVLAAHGRVLIGLRKTIESFSTVMSAISSPQPSLGKEVALTTQCPLLFVIFPIVTSIAPLYYK